MLQDVWDARVVWGVGLEADREDIVGVVARNVQVFGTRLVVPQVQCRQLELGNVLGAEEGEAMQLLAGLGELREIGRSSRRPFGRAAEHLDGGGGGGVSNPGNVSCLMKLVVESGNIEAKSLKPSVAPAHSDSVESTELSTNRRPEALNPTERRGVGRSPRPSIHMENSTCSIK